MEVYAARGPLERAVAVFAQEREAEMSEVVKVSPELEKYYLRMMAENERGMREMGEWAQWQNGWQARLLRWTKRRFRPPNIRR